MPILHIYKRRPVLTIALVTILTLGLFVLLSLMWLTSPLGESSLVYLIQKSASAALAPLGQRVQLHGASGTVSGKIRLWHISVQDADGEWLYIPELSLSLAPIPLAYAPDGMMEVRIQTLHITSAQYTRPPEYTRHDRVTHDNATTPVVAFSFMPQNTRLRVHNLEVQNLRSTWQDTPLISSLRASGYISAHHAYLRLAVASKTTALQNSALDRTLKETLTLPDDLPEDVTVSQALSQTATAILPETASVAVDQNTYGRAGDTLMLHMVLAYAEGFADMRVVLRDALILPHHNHAIQRVWTRSRIQGFMPTAHVRHIRWVSRFGFRGDIPGERIRASLFSGHILWDNERKMVRHVHLALPQRDPILELTAHFGLHTLHGPGGSLLAQSHNVADIWRVLGVEDTYNAVQGGFRLKADVSRGGEHAAWWQKPLPLPKAFVEYPLPGLENSVETPIISTELTESPALLPVEAMPTVAGVKASQSPTALHVSATLESPHFVLPQGSVEQLHLTLEGSSLDASTAPEGTVARKHAAAHGEETMQTIDVTQTDTDAYDFTALGLPQGMVGTLQGNIHNMFGEGPAAIHTQWVAAGMHEQARIFQGIVHQIQSTLPGMEVTGDMSFSYALPRRRFWPWVDGELHITTQNTNKLMEWLGLTQRMQGLGLHTTWESLFDEKGRARQYVQARMTADAIFTPQWQTHKVQGHFTSQHVHALADTLSLGSALNTTQQGYITNTADGNTMTSDDDLSLLIVNMSMGQGSGGPLRWDTGTAHLEVQGENATFTAKMKGNIDALVAGSYNFRQRVFRISQVTVQE